MIINLVEFKVQISLVINCKLTNLKTQKQKSSISHLKQSHMNRTISSIKNHKIGKTTIDTFLTQSLSIEWVLKLSKIKKPLFKEKDKPNKLMSFYNNIKKTKIQFTFSHKGKLSRTESFKIIIVKGGSIHKKIIQVHYLI